MAQILASLGLGQQGMGTVGMTGAAGTSQAVPVAGSGAMPPAFGAAGASGSMPTFAFTGHPGFDQLLSARHPELAQIGQLVQLHQQQARAQAQSGGGAPPLQHGGGKGS